MNTLATEIFGEPIHSYTREQAIEDGFLVDATETAREAGFCIPVALTRAAWEDCVEWNEADSKRQTYQDLSGRLWDVVNMAFFAAHMGKKQSSLLYQVYRIPRGGRGKKARRVMLKSMVGPGDQGEPVVTIMLPNED